MRYLLSHRTHPTADEVFEGLKTEIPTLSKTTVYNTLKLFVDYGAAIYVGIDEKNARFDGFIEPHAHFRCKKCGYILDIPFNFKELISVVPEVEVEDTFIYLKGICQKCKK
jgi:Fe2+ or Zn2+ uptake regulation protein